MNFKVEVKPWVEDNFRNELVITHNGKEILSELDDGEPENNRFTKDWNWVQPALEQAYLLGAMDGVTKL